ncbi:MAG TPA: outer membrane beta-barrel protein [Candidatus Eisenbacteria bacterium]|nr:outer membrane beta-barrel protein [Candidatus Eisenbacteria bacterium]
MPVRIAALAMSLALAWPAAPAGAADSTHVAAPAPFAFADFGWVPGNAGAPDRPLTAGPFTGEFRLDDAYHWEFSNPKDNTISGSSEVFRHGEFQVTQLGIGGDIAWKNVTGRLMTQFGMYSQTTPRNDASPGRGQWNLDNAYRYISEAYGGYHIDALHGINVQAGIFMSYIGLWSYYNADNWTYQPSYVSSNTPWFFNGMRLQMFPSDKLKIEPWLVNGWQSYGRFNDAPGGGGQILWRPNGSLSIVGNQYVGKDVLAVPKRIRVHTDDSIMAKYLDHPGRRLDKAAWSLTLDAGGESGAGVTMSSQYFLGFMAYNRLWFSRDKVGFTFGGGAINNPGRYLVLLPPINGATAFSGTPYFTENPGDDYHAWDLQLSTDYSPQPYVTFRLEYNHRHASVPYFSGPGGVTPPGGDQGVPGSPVPNWSPDLRRNEDRLTVALLVKM